MSEWTCRHVVVRERRSWVGNRLKMLRRIWDECQSAWSMLLVSRDEGYLVRQRKESLLLVNLTHGLDLAHEHYLTSIASGCRMTDQRNMLM